MPNLQFFQTAYMTSSRYDKFALHVVKINTHVYYFNPQFCTLTHFHPNICTLLFADFCSQILTCDGKTKKS